MQVIGGGALGSLVAARLVRAGVEACLVLRPGSRKEALCLGKRTVSVVVEEVGKDSISVEVPLCRNVVGRCVVCTKAFDAAAAVGSRASTLLLGNGVLALRDSLPGAVSATTTHGCYEIEPFRVMHAGSGRLWMDAASEEGAAFFEDFEGANLNAVPLSTEDMDDRLWSKLAANCVLNPLTALFACRNGEALNSEDRRAQARTLCEEIANLRRRKRREERNIEKQPDDDKDTLYEDVLDCARENANNFSSMYQDLKHNRRTEIDFLNGWIAQEGDRLGVPTPANARLCAEIKQRESQLGLHTASPSP